MRRRLSLRGRMVTTAVAAAGVALGVLLLLAGPTLERRARDDTFRTLTAEARLMARVVEDELARGTGIADLDPVVDAAAREVDSRVTVIATDGRVLADSALSGIDLEQAILSKLERNYRRSWDGRPPAVGPGNAEGAG